MKLCGSNILLVNVRLVKNQNKLKKKEKIERFVIPDWYDNVKFFSNKNSLVNFFKY